MDSATVTTASHRRPPELVGLAVLIVAATIFAYWGVWRFDFIVVDDPLYVWAQPIVTRGLSLEGVRWAFTTFTLANYHPLTWLSHMLDCQFFGVSPGPQHVVNLALHVVNAILMLLLFHRMTGALYASAFIAAVFALHPMHVESVAWIAERKDVLSMLFALLAMIAYAGYVRSLATWQYLLVFLFFGLGLLAKPMIVTLPFVLLLLDFWPLGRSRFWRRDAAVSDVPVEATPVLELILEKIPMVAMSAVSCITTVIAQSRGGSVSTAGMISLRARMRNVVEGYVDYLSKIALPRRLCFFYPYTSQWNIPRLLLYAALLGGVSLLVLWQWRKRPWLGVGWFWFLGTLVPVIGFVAVGGQSIADRYTYLPMTGVAIMLAWSAVAVARGRPSLRPALACLAGGVLVALTVASRAQTRYWADSVTVAQRAIDMTDATNDFAYAALGRGYARQGKLDEAIDALTTAERLRPGRYRESLEIFEEEKRRHDSGLPNSLPRDDRDQRALQGAQ